MPPRVSDSVVIAATPEQVYRCVSDPTQFGRWSEENVGATVVGDWTGGARVGMQFDGHNEWNPKLRGRWFPIRRWTTRCEVIAAEEARHFAFRAWLPMLGDRGRPRLKVPLAVWDYRLESVPGGTRVTETWTAEMSASLIRFSQPLTPYLLADGVTVETFQARNIAWMLASLKQDLEKAPSSG